MSGAVRMSCPMVDDATHGLGHVLSCTASKRQDRPWSGCIGQIGLQIAFICTHGLCQKLDKLRNSGNERIKIILDGRWVLVLIHVV